MLKIALMVFGLLSLSTEVTASCASGKSSQSVRLAIEGKAHDRWEPAEGHIHQVRLPQGFELGVRIEAATDEKYRELFARRGGRGVDELVKIELYDMSGAKPVLVSSTWGGANSLQGFGPRGGANGVPALGEQIELWLHKPYCVTPERLAAKK